MEYKTTTGWRQASQVNSGPAPDKVLVPASPTAYKLVKLADEKEAKLIAMTEETLASLIKKAGKKSQLNVTTKMGSVITHVERSKKTKRFTGYKGTTLVTFYANNVRSYELVKRQPFPVVTFENATTDDEYFAY